MTSGTKRLPHGAYASGLLAGTTVLTAALGWCALLVVARWADPSTYVVFAVVWALYYAIAGSVAGLQLEVTRWIATSQQGPSAVSGGIHPRSDGPGLIWVSALIGILSALTVLATFPLWRDSLGVGWSAAGVLALGALTLTGLIVVLGVLVAQRRWRVAAIVLTADSVVRLGSTALAAGLSASIDWYALAIVSGSLVWIPLLATTRRPFAAVDWTQSAPGLLSRALSAVTSTLGASVLIAGLPWLYAVTSSGQEVELSTGLIAGLVLFRSPVLALAQGVRPVILRELLDAPARARAHMRRAVAGYVLAAGLFTGCTYVLGPPLLASTFGDAYEVSGAQAAGLVLSAVLLSFAVHISVAFVALDNHRRGTEGWLVAVLASLVFLLSPIDGSSRLLGAAVGGPALGVAYLGVAWVVTHQRRRAVS